MLGASCSAQQINERLGMHDAASPAIIKIVSGSSKNRNSNVTPTRLSRTLRPVRCPR